ncbi:type I toxin-antitoxin system Ibs family toxin, partial [Escherichia coli]
LVIILIVLLLVSFAAY